MVNMDIMPTTAPNLVFARETYTPYSPANPLQQSVRQQQDAQQKQHKVWQERVLYITSIYAGVFNDLKKYIQLGRHDIFVVVHAENYWIILPK